MSLMDRFRLDGQVAVVTGGGRGIGRGIALGLADAGADVLVAARRTHEIEAVAEEIRALGRHALAVTTDVLEQSQLERLAETAVKELGSLGCWVNNAGGAEDRTMRSFVDTPEKAWDNQLALNLKAVWAGSRAAATQMGEGGGSIVNISSTASLVPSPTNGPYAVAKAGVNAFTKTLSVELASRGIRVNAVLPGPVPTEVFMEALGIPEEALPELPKRIGIPLRRLGEPEDVAAAVVYLASSAASWVTGELLVVSGGL